MEPPPSSPIASTAPRATSQAASCSSRQPWLWLFQLWYHLPGWRNSTNVDLIAIYMTGLATLLLLFVPFIPGLRDIPRWIPVHRLVWRDWIKRQVGSQPGSEPIGQR